MMKDSTEGYVGLLAILGLIILLLRKRSGVAMKAKVQVLATGVRNSTEICLHPLFSFSSLKNYQSPL